MAGTIYKRGPKTWQVRIYMGRDPETGRRINHNKTVHGTKKDAERYLNGILRDRDLGRFAEPSRLALNDYLDKWLENSVRHGVAASTYDDYESLLARYIRPRLGHLRLDKLVPLQLQTAYTEMTSQGLSARTVRYTHAVLASALKQAIKWGMLATNPANNVDLPKQIRKEMQFLTAPQVERFLEAATYDRWGIFFSFAIATGMRPGEVMGLMWKDVDWTRRTVTVRRSLVRDRKGGGWRFKETKTSRSRRMLVVPPSLVTELKDYREAQLVDRRAEDYADHDLVFATSKGLPLRARNLTRRHLRPTLRAAGLPDTLRLYDLRHTTASLLLAAGVSPKLISERLGHASVVLTLDVYSHVIPSMQEAAADMLETILYRPQDEP